MHSQVIVGIVWCFSPPPYYITNDIAGYPEIASMKSLQYKVGPH
jgi:hypothetical protein